MSTRTTTTTTTMIVQPTFNFRARFWQLFWICPYSGHFNHSTLKPTEHRIECTCSRRFVPGVSLYGLPRGATHIPPDWVIPIPREQWNSNVGLREIMPMGDLAVVRWQRHQPTHVFHNPESLTPGAGTGAGDYAGAGDYDVRSFIRHTRLVAETLSSSDTTIDIRGRSPIERLGLAFEVVVNAGAW
jgi:hypothetical protein